MPNPLAIPWVGSYCFPFSEEDAEAWRGWVSGLTAVGAELRATPPAADSREVTAWRLAGLRLSYAHQIPTRKSTGSEGVPCA